MGKEERRKQVMQDGLGYVGRMLGQTLPGLLGGRVSLLLRVRTRDSVTCVTRKKEGMNRETKGERSREQMLDKRCRTLIKSKKMAKINVAWRKKTENA